MDLLGLFNYWVFAILLMIGFYARLAGLDIDAQDTVVREYLLHEFGSSL